MSDLPRMQSVPARGALNESCNSPEVWAENAAKREEAMAHMRKAAHLLGYHPEELALAREMLPESLRDHEVAGFVPAHVAVNLWKRIAQLGQLASLLDTLERAPELKAQLMARHERQTRGARAGTQKSADNRRSA